MTDWIVQLSKDGPVIAVGDVDLPRGTSLELRKHWDPILTLWVFADAPGNDHYNLNGEYVVVTNNSSTAVEIGGWNLCDAARGCFTFPAGATVPPGRKVVVFTGSGRKDGTNFYMNRGRAVWNNRAMWRRCGIRWDVQ